jgi:hypothetical protein
MGSIDNTLFTLKHDNDFLLVQIYVDDIIFGGSSHVLVSSFQKIMKNDFQMSMMEGLTFFRYPSQANEAGHFCTLLSLILSMAMISYLFRFTWMILFSVTLLMCLYQILRK